LFPVLRAAASFYILRTEYDKASQVSERILQLAEQLDDADMRIDGYMVLGYCVAFVEDPRKGLEYLEKALVLYDPGRQRPRRLGLGSKPGVIGLMVSSLLLWMLGYPDTAQKRTVDAIAIAQKMGHPYTKAYVRFHAGLLNMWLGNHSISLEHAQEVLHISEEHGFKIWSAVGTCLKGAALAYMGDAENGLALVEQGIAAYRERGMKTPPVFWPLLLHLSASAYGAASKPGRGMELMNEAAEAAMADSSKTMKSEFLFLMGELLLALSPQNAADVESLYRQAVDNAREVHTPTLELRAALRLSRLWQGQGRKEEARTLLSEACAKLTEGSTMHDLKEANALLAELS
jgi:predicted ATPase